MVQPSAPATAVAARIGVILFHEDPLVKEVLLVHVDCYLISELAQTHEDWVRKLKLKGAPEAIEIKLYRLERELDQVIVLRQFRKLYERILHWCFAKIRLIRVITRHKKCLAEFDCD